MRQRGFTLLEMLVATVIMAVAVVGLLSGISGALRNAARLTDYDRAVQLARERMNSLLVDDKFPRGAVITGSFDPQQTGGLEAGWRAQVANFEMPPGASVGVVALDRINLEVWWMSGPQRRSLTLEAYRPHALRAEELVPAGAPR